jgi:putative transposase
MLVPGNTYHLYNHANGKENLFAEPKNYDYFLGRLSVHVLPVAHMYAYCLMPNHFHLLVKIRSEAELENYFQSKPPVLGQKAVKSSLLVTPDLAIDEQFYIKKVSKSFSNAFNSYTQAFNRMYDRMGSLFMQNMKNEEVLTDESFCKVVHYIHSNPVHHRFVKRIDEWPHSSYKVFLSKAPTRLDRDYVLNVFGGLDSFIDYHNQPIDPKYR